MIGSELARTGLLVMLTTAALVLEELLFRGHPEVVDDDLADYFGSIPHSDLLKSVAAGSLIGACCI